MQTKKLRALALGLAAALLLGLAAPTAILAEDSLPVSEADVSDVSAVQPEREGEGDDPEASESLPGEETEEPEGSESETVDAPEGSEPAEETLNDPEAPPEEAPGADPEQDADEGRFGLPQSAMGEVTADSLPGIAATAGDVPQSLTEYLINTDSYTNMPGIYTLVSHHTGHMALSIQAPGHFNITGAAPIAEVSIANNVGEVYITLDHAGGANLTYGNAEAYLACGENNTVTLYAAFAGTPTMPLQYTGTVTGTIMHCPPSSNLTLDGEAGSGFSFAGNGDYTAIGGGGAITITGGSYAVDTQHNSNAPAITAGQNVLHITGTAEVRVENHTGYGAAIGGGNGGDGGTISISGGEVHATTNGYGAAIGGGWGGDGGTISMSGGEVYATTNSFGAAIGGGYCGLAGDITINGTAVVEARSLGRGAAIGGGSFGGNPNTLNGGAIAINGDADVKAYSTGNAAAIGGGDSGPGGTIGIGGAATVTATAGSGANAPAIGPGNNPQYADAGNIADITISGGTVAAANAGTGAAIGRGEVHNNLEISVTIQDAIVTLAGGGIRASAGQTSVHNSTLYYMAESPTDPAGLAFTFGATKNQPTALTVDVGEIAQSDDFGYVTYVDNNTSGIIYIEKALPEEKEITLTGATTKNTVRINAEQSHLLLSDVDIVYSDSGTVLSLESGAQTATLRLEGDNNRLQGNPGINMDRNTNQALHIVGPGALTAHGGSAPGIFCNNNTLTITGGARLTASTSGSSAAAIGGRSTYSGGNVTISGEDTEVWATGGSNAPDIGAGHLGQDGGTLEVSDGATLHLLSGGLKNLLDYQPATTLQNATLTYGTEALDANNNPTDRYGLTFTYGDTPDTPTALTIDVGAITMGDDFGYVTYADNTTHNNTPYGYINVEEALPDKKEITLTGATTKNSVRINAQQSHLLLSDVDIGFPVAGAALGLYSSPQTTLRLEGDDNRLQGSKGIDTGFTGQALHIVGGGALTAHGISGSGIDCYNDTLTITGGARLTASTDDSSAAAIGGGLVAGGGNVTISGSNTEVWATGGDSAADIGAGAGGADGSTLAVLDGATVHFGNNGLSNIDGTQTDLTLGESTLVDDNSGNAIGGLAGSYHTLTVVDGTATPTEQLAYTQAHNYVLKGDAKATLHYTGTPAEGQGLGGWQVKNGDDNAIAHQNSSYTLTMPGQNTTVQPILAPLNAQAPVVDPLPTPNTVTVGGSLTLTASATVSDGGTLSYQWYQYANASGGNATALSGETAASLTVPTGTAGTYYYGVTVTNTNPAAVQNPTAQTRSNIAAITVEEAAPANWQVEYDANGGTGTAPAPQDVAEGDTFNAAPADTFTPPEGHAFKEWNTQSDSGGTKYAPGEPVQMPTGGITLYAIWQQNDPGPGPADPEIPTISAQPEGASYKVGDTAQPLKVTATVGDSGTLTYQWYTATSNSNTGGTAVAGATKASYTPSTTKAGEAWYYVVVTNTLNGKTSTVASQAVLVKVEAVTTTDPKDSTTTDPKDSTTTDPKDSTTTDPTTGPKYTTTKKPGSGGSSGGKTTSSDDNELAITGLPGTIREGDTFTLIPEESDTRSGSDGWQWDAEYFSATFNSPATFTALKAGETTITFTSATGRSVTLNITVLEKVKPGSSASASTSSTSKGGAVASTGDSGMVWLYAVLAGLAVIVAGGLVWYKRRKASKK